MWEEDQSFSGICPTCGQKYMGEKYIDHYPEYAGYDRRKKERRKGEWRDAGKWTVYSIPRNMGKSWIQKQYDDFYRGRRQKNRRKSPYPQEI